MTQSNYPKYGTSFWQYVNNYGFGVRNIAQNAQNHLVMNMMPMQNMVQQEESGDNNPNFWEAV